MFSVFISVNAILICEKWRTTGLEGHEVRGVYEGATALFLQ
jgi:hypothetical protein